MSGILNEEYCSTASLIWLYRSGRPPTIEIICCTNTLPNRVSIATTITVSPSRVTAEAAPRFQPCRTIITTIGSIASARNIEMTTSSTTYDTSPHERHTKIDRNTAMAAYSRPRPHQSGGRRESPLAGNTDAKSILCSSCCVMAPYSIVPPARRRR